MKTLLYLSLTLAACRLYAQPPAPVTTAPPAAAPQKASSAEVAPAQNPLIRHLPPDACGIYHFNLPVLRTRLPLQQLIERIPLPQQNTYNRELAAILREPTRAGVDTTCDIFLTETNAQGRDSLQTTSLLVHLTDSALWGAFLREQAPGIHIDTKGSTHYAGQDRMGAAWDKDLAILTFVRSMAQKIPPTGAAPRATRQSQTLLKGFSDSARIHDPLFLAGFSDNADIHAWTDQGQILFLLCQQLFHLDHTPAYPTLTPPGCGRVRTLSALWFEKGRVRLKNTLCLPPGADSLYARLTARPLSDDLLSHIPPGKLLAMFNLHFDPAAIPRLLDGLQARGRSEALLFDRGVSLETFERAFQGNFMFVALQPPTPLSPSPLPSPLPSTPPTPPTSLPPAPPPAPHPGAPGLPRPALYLATTVRDLPAFWSWTSHLKWLTPTTNPSGAGRVSTRNPISKHLPAFRIKDSLLVIGSSQKRVAAWFDDSTRIAPTRISPDRPASTTRVIALRDSTTHLNALRRLHKSPLADSPLNGWIDFKAVTTALQQRPPAERNRTLLSILSALDLLTFTAGHLNASGQLENTTELTLVNSEENSLKTLFGLLQ